MSETQISDAHGEAVDEDKRDFIFIATGAAAAAGAGLLAWPLVSQMGKAADTLAAGSIEINLAGIATAAEIAAAEAVDLDSLPDAQADNDRLIAKPDGTIDPRYLVMVGVCTHFGCIPVGEAGDFDGLALCLVAQIITGIILAMHYVPHVDLAFESVQRIRRDVPFGWLLQPMHAVGASMFFFAVYVHMFRGLYYGSYKAPREVLWIIGCLIYLVMMATGFLGYTLPWGQMSFWGATVITGFFGAVPVVGESLQQWLLGGYAVDNATLNRFFALHYLLPFVIAGLVGLHVWALHHVGQNNPIGITEKTS